MGFAKSRRTESSDNASVSAWIAAFLSEKPLSSVRKVNEWQDWAIRKLSTGWTPEAVKQRIRDAWSEWVVGGNVDTKPMPKALLEALNDVYKMADEGASPAACAVVYRSLSRQYPERVWLADAAIAWEDMGEKWPLTRTR
jgi:hypothetical protein